MLQDVTYKNTFIGTRFQFVSSISPYVWVTRTTKRTKKGQIWVTTKKMKIRTRPTNDRRWKKVNDKVGTESSFNPKRGQGMTSV